MPQVTRLGHVGLFCNDLLKMRDFYSRIMGLKITDENLERGICFLSATMHSIPLMPGRLMSINTTSTSCAGRPSNAVSPSGNTWMHSKPFEPLINTRSASRMSSVSSTTDTRILSSLMLW